MCVCMCVWVDSCMAVPNLVIHAIEQPRHHWENSGAQLLHVLRKKANITLEESHPPSMTKHYRLEVGGENSVS